MARRTHRDVEGHHAVVAGLGLNGLGVVRALASAGVPIVALDTDLARPEAATRFASKVQVAALSGPAFVDALKRLRQRFQTPPVLFLTEEKSVATVSAMRAEITSLYRFTMADDAVMRMLMDKLQFQAFAERNGFRIPRAVRLDQSADLASLSDLRFPAVLKPATKTQAYSERFLKAYRVNDRAAVEKLWAAMREVVDAVIVQEWIDGGDEDIYFCLQYRRSDSGFGFSFVGRKTRQWPPLTGGTASCVPAPEAEEALSADTDAVFQKAGLAGLCSMEFKRDPRDGQFYLIEPTVGRTDYQEEIAALNGANIPFACYCGELGLPLPERELPRQPRAWRDPFGAAKAREAGSLEKLPSDVAVCDAFFRFNDPGPFLSLRMQSVRRVLSRSRA